MNAEERFLTSFIPDPNSGCWIWVGGLSGRGYGRIYVQGRNISAHRFSMELVGKPIADGYLADHVCRVRPCVNPNHIRSVTQRLNSIENSIGPTAINAAKTRCSKGHEFLEENTIITIVKSGKNKGQMQRRCRKCCTLNWRDAYIRRKAKNKLAKQDTRPDWNDLRGVAPDATGDLSSEDFVRKQRDEWDKQEGQT